MSKIARAIKFLICLALMTGLAACAAPSEGTPLKETHGSDNHILPPGFPVSEEPNSEERYCGGFRQAPAPVCDEPREYCHREIKDICGAADAPGICRIRPEICTQDYTPVCGCDGKTYSNACTANSNGVSVAANGECKG